RLLPDDGALVLLVADDGPGIPPEERDRVMEPFARGAGVTGRGTGLGLAIVNHILADHSAHIRVEENLPAGTRFIIEIPLAADTSEEARVSESAIPATHV
ncbi:MAG TPA: ATP-binding protein, partial [Bryobacteraceae bacterium]|nr:ATP-binding protein [Bryobacteraceae bacterium]